MVIFKTRHRFLRGLAHLWLLFATAAAWAAPGFVASSRVSGDASLASIEIQFNCKVSYLQHEPPGNSDRLRIYLDTTGICNGVPATAAESRGRYRPARSELARLVDLEYDGSSPSGPMLTLTFSEYVEYTIEAEPISFRLVVNVRSRLQPAPPDEQLDVQHRQVQRVREETPDFVINLVSFRRMPTVADVPAIELGTNQRIFFTEVDIDGTTWYRLRLGDFPTNAEARIALDSLKADFPGAWIDQLDGDSMAVNLVGGSADAETRAEEVSAEPADIEAGEPGSEIEALMAEARKTLVAGDRSRAIQIYTKILQLPPHPLQADAQELLALAREKNGQIAHAKAEYQRYLSLYPENEGASRVQQRLAALLARDRQVDTADAGTQQAVSQPARKGGDWRFQTFFSQYYRRDVNQQTDQNEIVSQSALYSDVNFDARRRGERFDFSARVSAGYRNDFLNESFGSGNDSRISYAYADLADAKTGVRGRIGRQSRNTGGVLGRFDGLNLGYQVTERILVNAVVGKPAYSASDGVDSARTFYGLSANYGPVFGGLEAGLYFVQQEIEGIDDRQALGGEFRYFGENQSIWGQIDYDTLYDELGSAFLQGNWRIGSRLTVHAAFDQRHSPFLSTGNALIGQPVASFAELLEIYPVDEIRQFGVDRSPLSTTYTAGFSYSLTPKLQISADANETSVEATPESGGVFATPESSYQYFSTNIVASSLFTEGDVSILSLRQSSTETSDVLSMTLDSRFPFGRSWRVNPRLRVDRRDRDTDTDYEWIYTPGIRIQYRRGQRMRIEFEAGKQYSLRETPTADLDRESYFVNLGYQLFF